MAETGGKVRIVFMGDVAFSDEYCTYIEQGGEPFRAIATLFDGADLVVGNLECQARGTRFNTLKVPYVHTSAEALRKGLPQLRLGLMSMANNHTHDNMAEGFGRSVQVLDELGVVHLGAGLTATEAHRPAVITLKGRRFGFLNFVHPDTHPSVPEPPEVHLNWFDMGRILTDIKALRPQVDHLIVLLHWGGKTDYGHLPHLEQVGQARAMVRAGADCIIGAHTHSFQGWTTFQGRPVYFGLGNLCFADILCEGVWSRVRNSGKWSALAHVEFGPDGRIRHGIAPFSRTALDLHPDSSKWLPILFWQAIGIKFRALPLLYPLYYRYLARIEPIFFFAQLNGTTVAGLVWRKLMRAVGLRRP